tara:strand:- start:1185 stop:1892 length:708 start_codon:yes stop_codon:yes gene_type:complete
MGTTPKDINTVKTELLSQIRQTLITQGIDDNEINKIFAEMDPMIETKISTYIDSVFTNNTCDYSDLINDFANTIQRYKDTKTSDDYADIENILSNIYIILDTYRNVYDNHYNRILELSDTRNNENKKLIKNVDNSNLLVNTNNRKVVYEKRQFEGLQTYRLVIFIAFYILLVIYLIFGNFFSSRLYRNRTFMYIFIPLCITPIAINYLVRFLYFIIKKINKFLNNRASKNVYTNI